MTTPTDSTPSTPKGWPPELTALGYRCEVRVGAVWWWKTSDTGTPGIPASDVRAIPAAVQEAVVQCWEHYRGTREAELERQLAEVTKERDALKARKDEELGKAYFKAWRRYL